MKIYQVSSKTAKKIKNGQVLLEKEDLKDTALLRGLVGLKDGSGNFLATAYLAEQNKGIGWVLAPYPLEMDQAFLLDLFSKARHHRRSYEEDDLTTAYRLFNQEGDGLGGLTIDRYGDYALFSWYNDFLYEKKGLIVSAFCQVYPELKGIYEKIRFKGMDFESAHIYGEQAPETFSILENGVTYQVFLNDGLMTGIFLDQHEVRASLVDGLAMGKSLLNMFSYTAAFSVAAAMGGARETVSVDLAKRSQELSRAHFEVNGLDLTSHHFLVMDVFAYFKYAKRHGLTFDVIVIDPPSFARNKKKTFSVHKDYHKLIAQALDILSPGGIIVASTNASNLSRSKFKEEIEKGLQGASYQVMQSYGLPADFRYKKKDERSNYLKVFTIKVNK